MKPAHVLANQHYQQAISFHQQQQLIKARQSLLSSLSLNPTNPSCLLLLGRTQLQLKQPQEALKHLQLATKLQPHLAPGWHYQGLAHTHLHHPNLAIKAYYQALLVDPSYYFSANNLGKLYLSQNQLDPALTCLQYAYRCHPHHSATNYNLGLLYKNKHRYAKSLHHLLLAHQQKPHNHRLSFHLADTYERLNQPAQAEPLYRRLLATDHSSLALCKLVNLYSYTNQFSPYSSLQPQLNSQTISQLKSHLTPQENPFTNLIRSTNKTQNLHLAQAWSRRLSSSVKPSPHRPSFSQPSKINLAYISHDFRDHVIAHQTYPLFAHHDRQLFRIFAYSYGPRDNSYFLQQIVSSCDYFHHLPHLSDQSIVNQIKSDNIHILIDLTGFTEGNRLSILAHHPAPLQINYLGFPGSLGSSFHDYIITDTILTPPSQQPFFTERFIHLPHCYQTNHPYFLPQSVIGSKTQYHLPSNRFIFTSFNNSHKLTFSTLKLWGQILHHCPQSILWLLDPNPLAKHQLIHTFSYLGINPNRLIFAPRLPLSQHLRRLQHADLVLDTPLFNGGATTANALKSSVPVLTLTGNRYVSRMSTSLLTHQGFSSLTTSHPQQYLHLATYLYHHPRSLLRLKQQLQHHLHTHPVFNLDRFTHHLELAYLTAWDRYQKSKPPRSFQVKDPLPLRS